MNKQWYNSETSASRKKKQLWSILYKCKECLYVWHLREFIIVVYVMCVYNHEVESYGCTLKQESKSRCLQQVTQMREEKLHFQSFCKWKGLWWIRVWRPLHRLAPSSNCRVEMWAQCCLIFLKFFKRSHRSGFLCEIVCQLKNILSFNHLENLLTQNVSFFNVKSNVRVSALLPTVYPGPL